MTKSAIVVGSVWRLFVLHLDVDATGSLLSRSGTGVLDPQGWPSATGNLNFSSKLSNVLCKTKINTKITVDGVVYNLL